MAEIVYPEGYDPQTNPVPMPVARLTHPLPPEVWGHPVTISGSSWDEEPLGSRGDPTVISLEDSWTEGWYLLELDEAEDEADFDERVAHIKEYVRLLESLDLSDNGLMELKEARQRLGRVDEIRADLKTDWDEYNTRCNGYLDAHSGTIKHHGSCPMHPAG